MSDVYAYSDVNRNTVMADDDDINFTGTWSSTGTYWADDRDAVVYGGAKYIAIVDNVGGVPTFIPRRGQSKWSSLVLVRQGTNTGNHTAEEAWQLADDAMDTATTALALANSVSGVADQADFVAGVALVTAWAGTAAAASAQAEASQAYQIAVAGTEGLNSANDLAYQALLTAWSGTNGANQASVIATAGTDAAAQALAVAQAGTSAAAQASALAFTALQTAWAGTTSYSETPWSGTIVVDLEGATYQKLTIHGTTFISVINPSPVRGVTAILASDIGIDAALSFTDGLIWFGQGVPDALPGGQRMIINFTSFGSVASEIHAAYVQQA